MHNSLCLLLLLVTFIMPLLPKSAEAHFYFSKDDVIPECYKMSPQGVEAVNQQYGIPSFHIDSVAAVPEWLEQLKMGDALTLRINFTVTHCRPFYIFIHPITENMAHVTNFTSPSPTFSPGENITGEYVAFIGYQRKPSADTTNRNAFIDGIKISFVDYGTHHEVASFEADIHATWVDEHIDPVITDTQFDKPMCINDYLWPEKQFPPQSLCSNDISFPAQEGYEVKQSIDLNSDGICELIVQAEYCRKTHDNTCHLLYKEQDGRFQKIFHFYNELEFFESYNEYTSIGAMEYGPNYDTYRMGVYRDGKYHTTYLRHPCKKISGVQQ